VSATARGATTTHPGPGVVVGLLLLAAVAWAGTVVVAQRMGVMAGTMGLAVPAFLLVWLLMMVAMMLPAVLPVARLHLRTIGQDRRVLRVAGFLSGYLLVWKAAGLPRALPPDQVGRILKTCDRTTNVGRRNYAMLILLAHLGLRAGEVTTLELDDLDWRRGELIIRGKGNRFERLPLPHAVGEAISDYLVHSRPQTDSRRVFLRARAPMADFISVGSITRAMENACRRAGLPAVGTHWLRRSTGTQLLRSGASLQEVSQVLRHRDLHTTSLYAKADRLSLRELARPWPVSAA